MKLKNPMLVVTDIDKSVEFYKKVFGLHVIMDFGANKTLTGGLALQTSETYKEFIGTSDISFGGNNFEVYFEEDDFEELLSFFPHPANTLPAITTAIAHAAAFFQIPFLIIQVSFPSFPLSISLFPSMGQLGFLQKE